MSETTAAESSPRDRPQLTVAELGAWPLLHGSLYLRDAHLAIRETGLRAPGRAGGSTNSFEYDTILGRTDYVFLAPPSLARGYGFGDVVLVDPSVLQIEGTRCALYDVGDVVTQLERLIEGPGYSLPEWICNPVVLTELAARHRSQSERLADVKAVPGGLRAYFIFCHTKQSVLSSPAFAEYVQGYVLEPDAFLRALVEQYSGVTVRDFLRRGPDIMKPEILVPRVVSSSHLLGCIVGGVWHPWTAPGSRDTAMRVDELVALRTASSSR